MDWTG